MTDTQAQVVGAESLVCVYFSERKLTPWAKKPRASICLESAEGARSFTSISCLKNKFSLCTSLMAKQGSETVTAYSKAEVRIISKKEREELKLKLHFYLYAQAVRGIYWLPPFPLAGEIQTSRSGPSPVFSELASLSSSSFSD